MKSVAHIIAAALLTTGAALANEPANTSGVDFEKRDANADGYISVSEWADIGQDISFEEIDSNNDRLLSERELRASNLEVKATSAYGESGSTATPASEDAGDRDDHHGVSDTSNDMTDTSAYRDASAGSDRMSRETSQSSSSQSTAKDQPTPQFSDMDRDRDRRVSQQEAQDSGYDYVVMYFEPMDVNRDGYLDENEWNAGNQGSGQQGNRNVSAGGDDGFGSLDRNQDGYIDRDEAAGTDYLESNFDSNDRNQDGLIDIGEAEDGFMEWDADAFDTYDVNEDNLLDSGEAGEFDYVDDNFDTWDEDGDGFLARDEVEGTFFDNNEYYDRH